MKVEILGKNQAILEADNYKALFSYGIPVAVIAFLDSGTRGFRTSDWHSVTTSRHINKFLSGIREVSEDSNISGLIARGFRRCWD